MFLEATDTYSLNVPDPNPGIISKPLFFALQCAGVAIDKIPHHAYVTSVCGGRWQVSTKISLHVAIRSWICSLHHTVTVTVAPWKRNTIVNPSLHLVARHAAPNQTRSQPVGMGDNRLSLCLRKLPAREPHGQDAKGRLRSRMQISMSPPARYHSILSKCVY